MTLPEAIFFDWDGTLVDTIPMLIDAHNHVRRMLGYDDWTNEEFYSNLKHSSLDLYPRIYGEQSDQALELLYTFVENNHLERLSILPHAAELLEWLSAQGVRVGIISNKKHVYLLREIDHLGWAHHVEIAIGAGQASANKPDAAPIIMAAEEIGVDHTEIFYVGDTITDLLAAKNTGCRAVFVTNGDDKDELIKEFSPFYVANDCKDLKNILNDSIQHGSSENTKQSSA